MLVVTGVPFDFAQGRLSTSQVESLGATRPASLRMTVYNVARLFEASRWIVLKV